MDPQIVVPKNVQLARHILFTISSVFAAVNEEHFINLVNLKWLIYLSNLKFRHGRVYKALFVHL